MKRHAAICLNPWMSAPAGAILVLMIVLLPSSRLDAKALQFDSVNAAEPSGKSPPEDRPTAIGIPSGIARVFDGKWIRRIVLAIRQSLQLENPVAAGAIEIATENDGAQFKRAFLVREGKADNAPEELIFAEGCRGVATVSEAGSEVSPAFPISKSRCR